MAPLANNVQAVWERGTTLALPLLGYPNRVEFPLQVARLMYKVMSEVSHFKGVNECGAFWGF